MKHHKASTGGHRVVSWCNKHRNGIQGGGAARNLLHPYANESSMQCSMMDHCGRIGSMCDGGGGSGTENCTTNYASNFCLSDPWAVELLTTASAPGR